MEAESGGDALSKLAFATLLIPLTLAAADARLASDLRPGMQLVYGSEGRDQAPWVVEQIEPAAPLKDGADCARLRIRRQPHQPGAEERLCVEGDTLYAWHAERSAWLPQRPVGPHMTLTLPRANGDTVRYATGDITDQTIARFHLRVVETTVTTSDAAGQPKRRLTERYAITLGTATGGRFEVPDPATPGAWRTEQIFELRDIR